MHEVPVAHRAPYAAEIIMRNASEAPPARPAHPMSDRSMGEALTALTVQTKFRLWYDDISSFVDHVDLDADDLSSHYLYRNHEEMQPFEVEAIHKGTPLTLTVTEFERDLGRITCDVDGHEDCTITLADGDTEGFHHIEVVTVGLPAPLRFGLSEGYFSFEADPASAVVELDGVEIEAAEARELFDALGAWLRFKGHNV